MPTIANKGRYVVKKCQKHVYVICEGSLISAFLAFMALRVKLLRSAEFLCQNGPDKAKKF